MREKTEKHYESIGFRAPRKARYLEAIAKRRERNPDLSEADWYREACDLLAARDLEPLKGARKH